MRKAANGHGRKKDLRWMTIHAVELHRKYPGKWVAIVDQHVAGVGRSATAAYRQAKRRYPDNEPILEAIEKTLLAIYVVL